jgi:hypothetical protein
MERRDRDFVRGAGAPRRGLSIRAPSFFPTLPSFFSTLAAPTNNLGGWGSQVLLGNAPLVREAQPALPSTSYAIVIQGSNA